MTESALWLSSSEIRFDEKCVQSNGDLQYILSVSNIVAKTHAVVFKIKTNNPQRYFVKPKRKILHDDEKHRVQITVHKREYRRAMEDSQQDKFLIQTLSIAKEDIKDLSEDETAKTVELRWKKAEKSSRSPFHYKYISTVFVDVDNNVVSRGTENLYKEFVSLRRSYEQTVADSIGQMAREERLRNRIAQLEKELLLRSKSLSNTEEAVSADKDMHSPPSIRPVHLLIVSMACFLLGHILTLQFEVDLRAWM